MIEQGIRRFTITDQRTSEKIEVLRPLPDRDSEWGVFECIRETEIGSLIPVVSGEALSHALHGYMQPLQDSLLRTPKHQFRKITEDLTCSEIEHCILANPAICVPCTATPHCYMPQGYQGQTAHAISTIVRAWADGRYVLVVSGVEFAY